MLKPFTLLLIGWGCLSTMKAQDITVIQASDLLNRIGKGGDTTYVINFWATWCAPCVRELHQFEKVNEHFADKGIKVLLVSLDFRKDYVTRLPSFIEKRGIKSEVLFLNEQDANQWVPLFHPYWPGVIPATWAVNSNRQVNLFEWSEWEEGGLEEWLREKVLPK